MSELITWQGKDIEKMSREDLIEALRALYKTIQEFSNASAQG